MKTKHQLFNSLIVATLILISLNVYASILPDNLFTMHISTTQPIKSDPNGVCENDPMFIPSSMVCFDSQDGNSYLINTAISCVVNKNNPYVSKEIKSICNGSLIPWSSNGYDATISALDTTTPPRFYMTYISYNMGTCSTTLQSTNLANLAGNIYTCNQSTGQFTVHTM